MKAALFDAFVSRTDVVIRDGTLSLNGPDLAARIDHWSNHLDRVGASRVAFQLPNGADWIALDLALLRSGRVAVPVPDFFTEAQFAHVIETAGIDTLVLPATRQHPGFEPGESLGSARLQRRVLNNPPPVHAGTAKITFTSGSTGTPKGVCLSAEHLLATATSIHAAFAGNAISRHLCVLPLALLLENVAGVYGSLLNGSEIIVPPLTELGMTGSSGLNIPAFIQAQHVHQPHSIILVPQLLQVLLGAAAAGLPLPRSYRMIAVGGARVAPHLLAAAELVDLPVFEGYGLSECGSVVSLNRPGAIRHGSVGKPLPHARISLRSGEVCVAGASMLGYLGEPAAPGVIATGDLGHLDADGYLFLDGRIRNVFITAFGRNVNPEWIESELTSEPLIAQAVAFGESLPGNIAVIVPRPAGGAPDTQAIEAAVQSANRRLPDYARIAAWCIADPRRFLEQGCATGSGKVRRDRVAEVFAVELDQAAESIRSACITPGLATGDRSVSSPQPTGYP